MFTPLYWGASVGEEIPTGEFSSVLINNPQPSLEDTYFGSPTGFIRSDGSTVIYR
jgi:hypothetical protein